MSPLVQYILGFFCRVSWVQTLGKDSIITDSLQHWSHGNEEAGGRCLVKWQALEKWDRNWWGILGHKKATAGTESTQCDTPTLVWIWKSTSVLCLGIGVCSCVYVCTLLSLLRKQSELVVLRPAGVWYELWTGKKDKEKTHKRKEKRNKETQWAQNCHTKKM